MGCEAQTFGTNYTTAARVIRMKPLALLLALFNLNLYLIPEQPLPVYEPRCYVIATDVKYCVMECACRV